MFISTEVLDFIKGTTALHFCHVRLIFICVSCLITMTITTPTILNNVIKESLLFKLFCLKSKKTSSGRNYMLCTYLQQLKHWIFNQQKNIIAYISMA